MNRSHFISHTCVQFCHSLRLPACELVIEFAPRRMAPKQERRGGRLGPAGRRRKWVHRIQQCLAAASASAGVVLDAHVLVRMVLEAAADKREMMPAGEPLPERILDIRPPVGVAARNEHNNA